MGQGFYQDELVRHSATGQGLLTPTAARPADGGGPEGRGIAVALHLLVMIGGPLGVALNIVLPLLLGRDGRPLVARTADAILRFLAQLAVLGVSGLVLVSGGHDHIGLALMVVTAGAYLLLPPLAAWRTWRTGRVFRYPVWDLVRQPE